METLSNKVEADAIVDRKDSLICLNRVEMEFLSMIGITILNSASSVSKDLILEAMRWPVWLVWNSCPTTRRPAWCRLNAAGLREVREEMSFVFGDSSYPRIGMRAQCLSYS